LFFAAFRGVAVRHADSDHFQPSNLGLFRFPSQHVVWKKRTDVLLLQKMSTAATVKTRTLLAASMFSFRDSGSCWRKMQAQYRSTSSSAASFWAPFCRSKYFGIHVLHFVFRCLFVYQNRVSVSLKTSTVARVKASFVSCSQHVFYHRKWFMRKAQFRSKSSSVTSFLVPSCRPQIFNIALRFPLTCSKCDSLISCSPYWCPFRPMESSLWSASQAASLVGVIRRISFLNYILASAVSSSRSEQSEQSRAVQQQKQSSQCRQKKENQIWERKPRPITKLVDKPKLSKQTSCLLCGERPCNPPPRTGWQTLLSVEF